MKNYIFILIFFLFSESTYASYNLNEKMKLAYSNIINLNFDEALLILESQKNINPDNSFILLNENYIDFLKILIGEDRSYYEKCKSNKNIRLSNLQKNSLDSPYHLYIQSEINLQWAFTRIKFKQYFLAAYELQRAYSLLKKNEKLYPDFILNKKSLGILKILIGSIPSEYSWILNIVGIEGNINSGFEDLYALLQSCYSDEKFSIFEEEILFYLSFLEMNMRNNHSSKEILLQKIEDCCLTNDLMIFCAARLSSRLGNNERTIKILEKRNINNDKFYFHYLDYLYAMSKMYQQDYIEAQKYFLKFNRNFNGSNYIKSSFHKLFLISLLNDSTENQEKYMKMVLDKGDLFIDEDKQAESETKNFKEINKDLLKSRLLFDGGYYQKALVQLNSIDELSLNGNAKNIIEYRYRKARVNQKISEKNQNIISLFFQVLEKDDNSNMYYHPMSTLQVATEYEKLGNYNEAIIFYKKVFDYADYDYEKGIQKSAQAGINRIKKLIP